MGIFVSRRIHSHDLSSRVARLAACLVLAAMSAEMAPPAPAAAAVPANTSTASPAIESQPSQASAPTTKPSATPTEVPTLRTAYSDTYDNHNGTYTTSVSSGPINYRASAGAAWTPIDLTLAAMSGSSGRVSVAKTPAPVEVGSPDDAAGFVSVDTGVGKISLSLAPGAKAGLSGSKPVASSNRADVAGLLPGVDLRVIPTTDGFRIFLVLAANPKTPTFTFSVRFVWSSGAQLSRSQYRVALRG